MVDPVLREEYGLTAYALEPIALGVINRNRRVVTPGGAFVLKEYVPDRVDRDEAQRACETQAYLRAAGLPVPAVRPNRAGGLVTERDGAFYTLTEWVTGRHYERGAIPDRAAQAMGEALGRVHQALAAMPAALGWEPAQPGPAPDKAGALERLERLLRLAEAHRERSPVDVAAVAMLAQKIRLLERFDASRFPAALTRQWVHGDYQESNVLLTPTDEVAAVLDFDNLRVRHRGLDFMRSFELIFAVGGALATEAWAFAAGYLAAVRPAPAEVALYAPLGACMMMTGDWPVSVRYLEPQHYDPKWDRFIRVPGPWWGENPGPVTERFLQILGQ